MKRRSFVVLIAMAIAGAVARVHALVWKQDLNWREKVLDQIKADAIALRKQGVPVWVNGSSQLEPHNHIRLALTQRDLWEMKQLVGYDEKAQRMQERDPEARLFGFRVRINQPHTGLIVVDECDYEG